MEAKQDIIQATEQDYVKLRAAIDGLDEAQMSEVWLGTWGVREILAHVAGWQVEMLPALERLACGEEPYAKGSYDDFDRWNARFVDARKETVEYAKTRLMSFCVRPIGPIAILYAPRAGCRRRTSRSARPRMASSRAWARPITASTPRRSSTGEDARGAEGRAR